MPVLCPFCGVRDEEEFVIDRTALIARPSLNVAHATRKREALARRVPAGTQLERWAHLFGCGRSFNVARDSRTQKIIQTYVIGEPPPGPTDA